MVWLGLLFEIPSSKVLDEHFGKHFQQKQDVYFDNRYLAIKI